MSFRDVRRSAVVWLDRHIFRITVIALVLGMFLVIFAHRIIVTIPAGYKGVLWERFGGTNVFRTYDEGTRFILPWNVMTLYNLRFQQIEDRFIAVDKDGLALDMQVTTRYRLNPLTLGDLHKLVGPDYVRVVMIPEVSAHTRTVVAQHTGEQVYAGLRASVEQQIRDRVRAEISIKGEGRPELQNFDYIFVEDILLRNIVLPPPVAAAIESKIQQYHVRAEWEFRREREKIEADRKEIEGSGIRRFQAQVGASLTNQFLRFRGIEATERLAQSPNSKIVIIGSGPSGLPLILGGEGEGPARVGGAPRVFTPGLPTEAEKAAGVPPTTTAPGALSPVTGVAGLAPPAPTPPPATADPRVVPAPPEPRALPAGAVNVPQATPKEPEGLLPYLGRLLGLRR